MWRVLLLIFISFPCMETCVEKTFRFTTVQVSLKSEKYYDIIDGCITSETLSKYNENSLIWILVYNQNIYVLKEGAVADIPDRFVITFDDCKTEVIKPGAFVNLEGIEDITITNNRIKNIETGTFGNLASLEKIILRKNDIVFLNRSAFQNLPSLKEVSLDHNKLTRFRQTWFEDTPKIVTLDLSHNVITKIEESSFTSLRSLKVLNLYNNVIESVDKHGFRNLYNLKYLNLGSNRLKVIDVECNHLKYLKFLFLHSNYLVYVSKDLIRGIQNVHPQIMHLVLHTNPLQCSCYEELVAWCSHYNVELNFNVPCTDPVCVGDSKDACDRRPSEETFQALNGSFYSKMASTCNPYELSDVILIH